MQLLPKKKPSILANHPKWRDIRQEKDFEILYGILNL